MITNTGKNILAKYLIDQAPAYASFIAIGCGARPLSTEQSFEDYSSKESLDFEMFRIPIISKGYVNENGVSKIVFTGELPSEERYEITEVGIYSAGSNPSAVGFDSRTIYSFSDTLLWEYHTEEAAVSIPVILEPLGGEGNDNIISQPYQVFQANADNKIFTNPSRIQRQERCRYLNNMIVISGNMSSLSLVDGHLEIGAGSDHIHNTNTTLDLRRYAPTDEIKIAFSVINKDGESVEVPDNVKILFEAASADSEDVENAQWARFEIDIDDTNYTSGNAEYVNDFSTNRYIVITKKFQDLYRSAGFSWNLIEVGKFYVTVTKSGMPTDDYYVCLDAVRVENVTTTNPLYGLTGYSVIKNQNGIPVIKSPNTSNYIEFRFGMDVAGVDTES